MTEPVVVKRRHRLTNMVYDEVSFVDAGANQHADVVLVKRAAGGPSKQKVSGGSQKVAGAASQTASWYSSTRTPTDASGTKTDLRAQHWEQSRHPRIENGTWAETSASSKKKYGKGGTTGKTKKLTAAQKAAKAKLRAAKKALAAKKRALAAKKRAEALKNKKVGYRLVMGPGGSKHWVKVKASLMTTKTPTVDRSGTVPKPKATVKKYLGISSDAVSYMERD